MAGDPVNQSSKQHGDFEKYVRTSVANARRHHTADSA